MHEINGNKHEQKHKKNKKITFQAPVIYIQHPENLKKVKKMTRSNKING